MLPVLSCRMMMAVIRLIVNVSELGAHAELCSPPTIIKVAKALGLAFGGE